MKALLAQLVDGQPLSRQQAIEAFELIMSGQAAQTQTAALLALLALRGPTVDEIVGGATVMRKHCVRVPVPDNLTIVDTCGTGGWSSQFFNISTSAAIVAAAAGRPLGVAVAKHGNRSVTSASGSSDVLALLGVKVPASIPTLTRCLDEIGICFCFAPAHHPAMKHAGPVRADLGFRTIFNILGPLTNPAGATRQLLGVPTPETASLVAKALLELGAQQAMVINSELPDGRRVGELTNMGPAYVQHLKDGKINRIDIDPADVGLPLGIPGSITVANPQESAELITRLLDGMHGPARDVVCLNAAAALLIADAVEDLKEGMVMANRAIDSGRAKQTLAALVSLTQADEAG